MPTKFERDLLAFRRHVVALRAMGWAHVSVKYNGNEFHCESPGPVSTEHKGEQLPLPTPDDDCHDKLGRP